MAWQPSRTACGGSAAGGDRGCGPSRPSTSPGIRILRHNGSGPPAPPPPTTSPLTGTGTGTGTGPNAVPLPTQAQLEHIKKKR